jgi:hypothetical protein
VLTDINAKALPLLMPFLIGIKANKVNKLREAKEAT